MAIDKEFSDYEKEISSQQMRGIKDANLFNSALYEPKQTFEKKELYPTILEKGACYLRSFSMNHPFFDGNKRTALLSTIIFLENNGYEVIASNEKLYKLVEKVVRGRLKIPSIVKRLKKYVKTSQRKRLLPPKELFMSLKNKLYLKNKNN